MTSPWSEGGKAEAENREARRAVAFKTAKMLTDSGLRTWEIIWVLATLLSTLVVSQAKTPADLAECSEAVIDMMREQLTP